MDLSQRVRIISYDDIGEMTSNINIMLENLGVTFKSLRDLTKKTYISSQTTYNEIDDSKVEFNDLKAQAELVKSNTINQITTINDTAKLLNNLLEIIQKSNDKIEEQAQFIDNFSIFGVI